MKTYKLLGGGIVKGESQKEVVEQLNATSIFGHSEDLKEFMHRTSEACALQTGSIIRTDSFVIFVKDLVDNNFLLEIDE